MTSAAIFVGRAQVRAAVDVVNRGGEVEAAHERLALYAETASA